MAEEFEDRLAEALRRDPLREQEPERVGRLIELCESRRLFKTPEGITENNS